MLSKTPSKNLRIVSHKPANNDKNDKAEKLIQLRFLLQVVSIYLRSLLKLKDSIRHKNNNPFV